MIKPEQSPFGGDAHFICSLDVEVLRAMYMAKCNYDPARHFDNLQKIDLYECQNTGMRFWQPSRVAGDEEFYASVSKLWPNYYKTDRWEYARARKVIGGGDSSVLEVGCGRGYFLKSLESHVNSAAGLELNSTAINEKVTKFPVHRTLLQNHAKTMAGRYDFVCSFQVLEHVVDPKDFLLASARLLRSGGRLIISTPNYEFPLHASGGDAFDLPPHHLNHFTPQVFKRIANLLGFRLVATISQETVEPRFETWISDEHSRLQRLIRSCINTVVSRISNKVTLGHTVLAIFKIP